MTAVASRLGSESAVESAANSESGSDADAAVCRMARLRVVRAGVQTTVQDVGGRTGLWDVGVPPSGAYDEFSAELGQLAVGNCASAAGLECVVAGPVLSVDRRVLICVTGAAGSARIDGIAVPRGEVTILEPGAQLDVGPIDGLGMRGYVAFAGGLDTEMVLGSRATFILGQFGGHEGRALQDGDELAIGSAENLSPGLDVTELLPALLSTWTVRVIAGPHGAPEHLSEVGAAEFFDSAWTVDHRADRTGIRLVGPLPRWSRTDGGEAGLHASNVHDSAYPVGGIMLSGDTPVIVGKDGPSLGGFVVPAVIISADRWMLGQLRPGDEVRLHPVSAEVAADAMAERRAVLADPAAATAALFHARHPGPASAAGEGAVEAQATARSMTEVATKTARVQPSRDHRPVPLVETHSGSGPSFTIRCSGDRHLLVEAGPAEFDLSVRVWIHLLAQALRADRPAGIVEVVEGVRSLLVAVDDSVLALSRLAGHLGDLAGGLADPDAVVLDVREVTMPIAFDDPQAHEAMRRYQATVRPDAPWCPDNVEFIRRVNDLQHRPEVFDIVAAATYLVVGLGDVYLGAPVAVPIDPRHRLVTTKYNPARTWTPQNAVGIGGIYLCVYGMEGPGGYQLVGRTVPVWRLSDRDEQPWLLRQFDRIRFVGVTAEELADRRADIKSGRLDLEMRPATFSMKEVFALTAEHEAEIATLRARRRAAFDAERQRWSA